MQRKKNIEKEEKRLRKEKDIFDLIKKRPNK